MSTLRIHRPDFVIPQEVEDGVWTVSYVDAAGRDYTHDFHGSYDMALRLCNRVRARGTIDTCLWAVYVPYGCNAWLDDGYEARQIEDERAAG